MLSTGLTVDDFYNIYQYSTIDNDDKKSLGAENVNIEKIKNKQCKFTEEY